MMSCPACHDGVDAMRRSCVQVTTQSGALPIDSLLDLGHDRAVAARNDWLADGWRLAVGRDDTESALALVLVRLQVGLPRWHRLRSSVAGVEGEGRRASGRSQ
jgi:hypothetical protein